MILRRDQVNGGFDGAVEQLITINFGLFYIDNDCIPSAGEIKIDLAKAKLKLICKKSLFLGLTVGVKRTDLGNLFSQ